MKFTWRKTLSNVAIVQKTLGVSTTCPPTSRLSIRKRKPSTVRSLAVEGSLAPRHLWRITCALLTGRPSWCVRRLSAVPPLSGACNSSGTWRDITENNLNDFQLCSVALLIAQCQLLLLKALWINVRTMISQKWLTLFQQLKCYQSAWLFIGPGTIMVYAMRSTHVSHWLTHWLTTLWNWCHDRGLY